VALGIIATDASGSDLTISGRTSETIELNDNYGLSTNPSGVLGSYSAGNFTALYRTPTTRFTLNGDIVYRKYFGSDTTLGSFSETTRDVVSFRVDHDGKALGDRDFFSVSRTRQDAAIAQRNDLGFSSGLNGDLIIYNIGAGGARRLTDKDVVSASVNYVNTTYSPSSDSTTPYSSYSGSAGWSHSTTRTIDLNVAGNVALSKYDNAANTQVISSRATGGVTIRLSNRLQVSGNAGIGIIKTDQDVAGPVAIVPAVTDPFNTPFFTPAPAISGTVMAPVWDASLNYQLLKNTGITFTASEAFTTGTLGDISNRRNFNLGLSHTVNSKSSISANITMSETGAPAGGFATTFYTGSLSYSYRLAREWFVTATYAYRQIQSTSSQTGSASSNSLLFVLSKDFVAKP